MSSSTEGSRFRRLFHPAATYAEERLVRGSVDPVTPPLLIIGPPRSGTTLFYQALTDRYFVSWFCNLADHYYRWPCLASRVAAARFASYRSDYRSAFGKTVGFAGPAEARKLWSTWFTYRYADERTDSPSIEHCRKVVGFVERVSGMPFVSKNPDHCIRIRALARTFPNAIYIRIHRNPIDTARSILNARKNFLGGYERWFGIRPPEISDVDERSPTDQAISQVLLLEARVAKELSAVVPADRMMNVEYESFCKEPEEQFRRLERVTALAGLELSVRNAVAPKFEQSGGKSLSQEMESELAESYRNLAREIPGPASG